ncbi:MAG: substrate-binding domain-containing protein [Armatimonadota bacterium]
MPTIRQLASIAGVSPATVSLALRNDPRISATTRRRIQELAAVYQYKVHPVRYPVIHARCGTIGYISTVSAYRQLDGMLSLAFAESYHIVPLKMREPSLTYIRLALETVIEQKMQGVVLSSSLLESIPADVLLNLASQNIPLVCIALSPTARPIDHVYANEDQIGQLAVEYLYALGHRQITFLGRLLEEPRARAFIKYAHQYGIALQCLTCPVFADLEDLLAETYESRALPTAFLCHNDLWAARTIHYLTHRGLRLPRDVSVLGCSNVHLLAQYIDPPLTTIDEFPEEIGRRAFALLLQRIQDGTPVGQFEPQTVLIEPQMVVRQSCGPPRHAALTAVRQVAKAPAAALSTARDTGNQRGRTSHIAWRPEDTEEMLEKRFLSETSTELRPRWQALWLLRQGYPQVEVASKVGVNRRTLHDWIAWYRTGGVSLIAGRHSGRQAGTHRRLTEQQCARLIDAVNRGVVQTNSQACCWVAEQCQVRYSYCGMRKLLARLHRDSINVVK